MVGRIPIVDVMPVVDSALAFPGPQLLLHAKATVGEWLPVRATIFREGHGLLGAEVVAIDSQGNRRESVPMTPRPSDEPDRYEAWIKPDMPGEWSFTILAFEEPTRDLLTAAGPYPLWVDRERALVGAWYEMFPRSEGAKTLKTKVVSGTFKTAAKRLDAIAAMGFDVVYLPPVHPIGESHRKGRNNAETAEPSDVGSPWGIGSPAGGHDAVHPDLGTLADFDAFVKRAAKLGLEVAIDLALQTSPDHPWVTEHREFFTIRPDGSIAYAENPPKKYQDIYPLNFDNAPEAIRAEILRVVKFWIDHGVRIFRVDNPHTKPLNFWEWLLGEVRSTNPDVIFLAEAFTNPAMLQGLGAVGFHQSYTYFTWRNTKSELTEYLTELTTETDHIVRPNLWVNTPDILHAYLQTGGKAAFEIRAILAATLSPSWGMYAGYELLEATPVAEGSEEYLDSEKYQIKVRDWSAPPLAPLVTRLNELRRAHPALRELRNLTFFDTEDDNILAFGKATGGSQGEADALIVVVNLDPHEAHETTVHLDPTWLARAESDTIEVHDELSDQSWTWSADNYVRLDPAVAPAHILSVKKVP